MDVFTWSPYDAPGLGLEFICHKLNVDPKCTLKKQKLKRPLGVNSDAVKEEMDKLKGATTIKEAFYLEWLANTVAMKKNRKWRMYIRRYWPTLGDPKRSFCYDGSYLCTN